jgi:hypothetical protein
MTETEWRDGYAILRGEDLHGKQIDATERVSFKYKLVTDDGSVLLDLDRIVHVGPVERSVTAAFVSVHDTEDDAEAITPLGWFQPPPGAGHVGGYVALTPGQEVRT